MGARIKSVKVCSVFLRLIQDVVMDIGLGVMACGKCRQIREQTMVSSLDSVHFNQGTSAGVHMAFRRVISKALQSGGLALSLAH